MPLNSSRFFSFNVIVTLNLHSVRINAAKYKQNKWRLSSDTLKWTLKWMFCLPS